MSTTTYELVVINDAVKTDEEITASLEKIEEVITKNGGTITNKDVWGKKRLAYQINRQRDGHYTLYHFESATDTKCLAELNRHLRISEEILRSMVTKAVLGKSKGNPALAEKFFAQRAAHSGPRRGGPPRRDDRRDDRPPRRESSEAPRTAPAEKTT